MPQHWVVMAFRALQTGSMKNRDRRLGRFARRVISLMFVILAVGLSANAKDQPVVGRKAAAKYLAKNGTDGTEPTKEPVEEVKSSKVGEDLLMLSLGSFINSKSYNWGGSDFDSVGRLSYGVTYIFGEWSKFDLSFRMDFNDYSVNGQRANKLSLLPILTFPQANRKFPLYFGFGAGLGVYFVQLPRESNISFDYQLLMGARFQDVIDNLGFFLELAIKNHLNVTSSGQFNGSALTAGIVFSF